jgi:hypothetical protein
MHSNLFDEFEWHPARGSDQRAGLAALWPRWAARGNPNRADSAPNTRASSASSTNAQHIIASQCVTCHAPLLGCWWGRVRARWSGTVPYLVSIRNILERFIDEMPEMQATIGIGRAIVQHPPRTARGRGLCGAMPSLLLLIQRKSLPELLYPLFTHARILVIGHGRFHHQHGGGVGMAWMRFVQPLAFLLVLFLLGRGRRTTDTGTSRGSSRTGSISCSRGRRTDRASAGAE